MRAPHAAGDPDAHLRETTETSEQVWRGRLLDVRRDTVRLPDGATATREYIRHPGAVVVVPLLEDGRLVLTRQWRHPLARVFVEFPAGKIDRGEAPLACGMRELTEETGYTAAEWARAGVMHNAIGYCDEAIEIWFARGLAEGAARPDDEEFVEAVVLDEAELADRVARGDVTDAKTIAGLLWLQNWRAGRWPLAWMPAPPS
jgi:ADP-ribose pyrophosphatase